MRQGKESATFEYDNNWLTNPNRFALQPALTLGPGSFHTTSNQPLFGAIGDSAPDRWGRILMTRAERRRAKRDGKTPRILMEIDYLLGVADVARQGAIRFARLQGGPFFADYTFTSIPPLMDLSRLLSATDDVIGDMDSDDAVNLILVPGSSLGGARPKASIRDRDGQLAIAKFPHKDDDFNHVLW